MHGKALRVQWQLKGWVAHMADTLLQLTYMSVCHPRMAESEIDRILSSARLHNRRNGITGLLIFNGHRFLQQIEGPAEAVEATFARISLDPRHRAPLVLSRIEAPFRAFSSWSMAFERIDSAAPEHRPSLIAQVQSMVARGDPLIGQHFLGHGAPVASKAA
jgi:hypothetical protein